VPVPQNFVERENIEGKGTQDFVCLPEALTQDELEVKRWIIKRQFGRRNLTTFQKSELALCYEKVESERAKKRQVRKSVPQDFGEQNKKNGEALVNAANKAGISHETVRKVKKILDSDKLPKPLASLLNIIWSKTYES